MRASRYLVPLLLTALLLLPGCGEQGGEMVLQPDVTPGPATETAQPVSTPAPTLPPEATPEGPGSISVSYSEEVRYRTDTGRLGLYYRNGEDSDKNVTVRVYMDYDGESYLLAESESLIPNSQVTSLDAGGALPETPEPGDYSGELRLEFFDPETTIGLAYSTVLPCTVTVLDGE